MEPKDLIDAGLTSNQAKVYLKLIAEPAQSGGQIAKGLTMERSFVYNVLAALTNKGLISHIFSENVKLFYPTDPAVLLKETEEKTGRIPGPCWVIFSSKRPPKNYGNSLKAREMKKSRSEKGF